MNLSVGIVGLPNVGKSTLFNALLKRQAALAANYPFATIEPNVGIVPVPDNRLKTLAEITAGEIASSTLSPRNDKLEILKQVQDDRSKWPPIKPATVEFVDIAGLVKGASEGAGLGNKFLSHIREVRIIAHVIRAFEDSNIVREGSVGVKEDYETIRTELALSDLQQIQNSKLKSQNSKLQLKTKNLLNEIEESLNEGKMFEASKLLKEEEDFVRSLNLLTAKTEIIVLNVEEKDYTREKIEQIIQKYKEQIASPSVGNDNMVVISAKIEEELAALSEDDQKQYLRDLGLEESGLERLIRLAYKKLGLISFLTAGEKEVRAWTVQNGTNAQEAAGEIHTDFIKNFIKAEVVPYDDFVANKGWKGSRATGKAGMEGKDYIVQDGDLIEFKIGR